ncbi:flagellar hook-basal body complex protein FliE [Acuticoccus sp.]|uniref:flagellar hook-basal body complex protein FliE n=1 Tax=Acuticoccus sp. TaxID=1904378 RepID=UPI003B52F6B8
MMNVTPVGGAATTRAAGVGAMAGGPATDNFAAMFEKVAVNARNAMQAGEAAAISGINGDTSVQNVVRAMMTAEQQLRAAVAVRDRVVAAYQEIARMQI